MKHAKANSKQRLKLVLMAVGMAALGATLIVLYIKVKPDAGKPADATAASSVTTTAPSTAPASAPAPTSAPAEAPIHHPPPVDPRAASARNMSAMLLLFGLMAFTVSGVCILLIVLDIRKSRPAWKTQTKYPRRR